MQKAAKYDPASDLQVRKWISEVVGDPTIVHQELSESKFQEEFGDGKTLCKYVSERVRTHVFQECMLP